jgi:hypothetical protein
LPNPHLFFVLPLQSIHFLLLVFRSFCLNLVQQLSLVQLLLVGVQVHLVAVFAEVQALVLLHSVFSFFGELAQLLLLHLLLVEESSLQLSLGLL